MTKKTNGSKEQEHPKPIIEVMENTLSATIGYAASQNISEELAASILILNELRCIHWHFDAGLQAREEVSNDSKR